MIWIVNTVFVILVSGIWGSIAMAVWLLIKKLLHKTNTMILFNMFRIVTALQLLFMVLLMALIGKMLFQNGDQTFTFCSPVIAQTCLGLLLIWISGMIYCIGRIWDEWYQVHCWTAGAFPADKEKQAQFRFVCQKAGLKPGRTKLYLKYGLSSGITTGLIHPKIILPVGKLGEQEFRFTVIHEMIHYRRGDLWLKWVAMMIHIIFWFSPLASRFLGEAEVWCEYACDYEVCKRTGVMRSYAEVLLQISLRQANESSGLIVSVGGNNCDVGGRVRRMLSIEKAKKGSSIIGIAAALVLSVAGTGAVFASTTAAAGGYETLYQATEVESVVNEGTVGEGNTVAQVYPDNSNIDPMEYANTGVEFVDTLPLDGYTIVDDDGEEGISAYATAKSINWTIAPEVMMRSAIFYTGAGTDICVNGRISPSGKVIRVGVIYPGGTRHCIYATGSFSYVFDAPYMGDYFVYAINDCSETITLVGAYSAY